MTKQYWTVIEWLGSRFEVTKHCGANVIEIRQDKDLGFWRGKKSVLVYFGHIDPLKEMVKFFEEN
jgi:hypothetical protein